MAVAALMAIWWVTETIPLAVTALIPLVLFPALGVLDGRAGRILMGFMATPPNAIIFGTNRIRIATMVRTGFLLNMLGIVVVVIVTWLLGSSVFDIDPGVLPAWLPR